MNLTTIRFLIALKNHSILKKESLTYRSSKTVLRVLISLYTEGYIQSFKIINKWINAPNPEQQLLEILRLLK